MGRDKAFVEVDGVPMVLRVATALRDGGCDEVVAIGGDAAALGLLGLDVVTDRFPGEGPLGGVLTALHESANAIEAVDVVVVVACDLPNLGSATISTLLAALEPPFEAAIAVPADGDLLSLCGAWNPVAAARIAAAFAAGERRMQAALDLVPHIPVPVSPGELRNMNAPDDLRQ